jgi:hypothetical protein
MALVAGDPRLGVTEPVVTAGRNGAICRCGGTVLSSQCDRNAHAKLASRGKCPNFQFIVRPRRLKSEEGTVLS